jgi:hypothetical protein
VLGNTSTFWHVTPCCPFKVIRRFGGTSIFWIEEKAKQETNMKHTANKVFLNPEDRRKMFHRNGLHGVTAQKTEIFKFDLILCDI